MSDKITDKNNNKNDESDEEETIPILIKNDNNENNTIYLSFWDNMLFTEVMLPNTLILEDGTEIFLRTNDYSKENANKINKRLDLYKKMKIV